MPRQQHITSTARHWMGDASFTTQQIFAALIEQHGFHDYIQIRVKGIDETRNPKVYVVRLQYREPFDLIWRDAQYCLSKADIILAALEDYPRMPQYHDA